VGFIATGSLLVVRGIKAGFPLVQLAPWLRSPGLVTNFVAVCAALIFYIVAADALGFIPTGAILLVGLLMKFGVPLGRAALVAIIATLVIHWLFCCCSVLLPWGVLERFAW
jgi:putative tricarboxylic transport membrane protein